MKPAGIHHHQIRVLIAAESDTLGTQLREDTLGINCCFGNRVNETDFGWIDIFAHFKTLKNI